MKVSKEKALKSCHNFWQIHNTAKGYPENYPDEVVRFLVRIDLAKSKGKNQNLKFWILVLVQAKIFSQF